MKDQRKSKLYSFLSDVSWRIFVQSMPVNLAEFRSAVIRDEKKRSFHKGQNEKWDVKFISAGSAPSPAKDKPEETTSM